MAELTTTRLNAESHLPLDQALLRLPCELVRKNFKTSQRIVERDRDNVIDTLRATANGALAGDAAPQSIKALDSMIAKMQGLKRKLDGLHEEEKRIHKNSRKRIQHLQDLYDIPSLADVKYEEWSRVRLNRLLVDYLLRNGYGESAKALAAEKGITELVDVDVFLHCHKIEQSLYEGRTQEALAWCNENKQALKKKLVSHDSQRLHNPRMHANSLGQSNLEFELRLQQYIELVRSGQKDQLLEAIKHAQKFIAPHRDTHTPEVDKAMGLLAYPVETRIERYSEMYSASRWNYLARLFVTNYHELLSLPERPLLHIALSAGLSSLKTPSCHSAYASSSSNASSSTTSVCPICSTELNDLARNVPYAHHTKSYVENDPVVLPNGRVYGRDRLFQISSQIGVPPGQVKDPTTGELFEQSRIRKVYIS
ncbi:MAG: GID complex subunit containing RING finger motif [Candelina mexicana]|nr:MAG: GID complex subunit containing RING finger motif [Candelina mexicana]